jgi:gliding motility-associated-like protein
MRRCAFTLIIVAATCVSLSAQHFAKSFELILPDSIEQIVPEIADIDNDGLLDVLLFARVAAGERYLMFVKGDTVNSPVISPNVLVVPAHSGFKLYDYDNDNQIDVLLSPENQNETFVYRNQGGFAFERISTGLPSFRTVTFSDLDSDGLPESILSGILDNGEFFTKTFKRSGSGWVVASDTLNALLSDIETGDFDHDGLTDVFLSGVTQNDSAFSALLTREAEGYASRIVSDFAGTDLIADVNHDGVMDIIGFGSDQNGNAAYRIIRSQGSAFETIESVRAVKVISTFWTDLNSDGKVDECTWGIDASGDTVNAIYYFDGETELIPHQNVRSQVFGDMEHDGDLDILHIEKSDNLILVWYTNSVPEKNLPPNGPKKGFAIPVYNRMLFYWEEPEDDHTPAQSLTYDLFIDGANWYSVGFDLMNHRRLLVAHGNNLTDRFRLLEGISSQNLSFAIQSVDNALHSGEKSVCIGARACVEFQEELVSACAQESILLEAPGAVMWFSFRDGYLGSAESLERKISEEDTVFFLMPSGTDCYVVKAFPTKIDDQITRFSDEIYACTGSTVSLSAPSAWTNVIWSSNAAGEIGEGSTIDFDVAGNDKVIAAFTSFPGCILEKEFSINVSAPALHVNPTSVRIVSGSKVNLSATGAERYQWSPSDHLSDAGISNPVASPLSSIQYTVTGYDSIGCEATAVVWIDVQSSGFVPSLFTPNADGNNDELKVYGLSAVDNFRIRIYNREGNEVYSTTSLSQALQRGWDGTTNGVRQPNGIYFWKVEGSFGSAELLLNGKKEGSFLLIR